MPFSWHPLLWLLAFSLLASPALATPPKSTPPSSPSPLPSASQAPSSALSLPPPPVPSLSSLQSPQGGILGFYRQPTVHKDTVVFSAEGSLWAASTNGGLARRLTSQGSEGFPRFSPDGKWISFAAEYAGDLDVYIMPSQGGPPTRLTFRDGPDIPVAWTPDSRSVVFLSRRRYLHWNSFAYQVDIDKPGIATRLPIGYAALLSFSPDGKKIAFNRNFREPRTWKRYTGGWAQDIWLADPKAQTFQRLTDFPGTDASPMWYKDRIYFVSDRSGERNLFSIHPDTRKVFQHTFHKGFDVLWPSLGGDQIVYQIGADIGLLDLRTQTSRILPIRLPTDAKARLPRSLNASAFVEWFGLSPKADRLLVVARGDVFHAPVEKGGVTIRVTQTSHAREKFASYSPDGKHLVALSDVSGEEEIVLLDPLGEKPPQALTKASKAWRFWPVWSPDSKSLAFADKNMELYILSVVDRSITRVEKSRVWEIVNYTWSPDSRFLAYQKHEDNGYRSIFLYDTRSKRSIRATPSWTEDFSPSFSPDGKYLAFLSLRRFNPFYNQFDFADVVNQTQEAYVLRLSKKTPSFFAPKDPLLDDANKAEEPKPASKPSNASSSKAKDAKKPKKPVVVELDEDGLLDRAEPVPGIPQGNYIGVVALNDRLLLNKAPVYRMLDAEHGRADFSTELLSYLFKDKTLKPFFANVSAYSLSYDRSKIAIHRQGSFFVFPTATPPPPPPKGLVDLSALRQVEVEPAGEWSQIFHEAWRLQRDFYWASDLAKVDWTSIGKRYQGLLSRLLSRVDLHFLLGELLGELGTSHTYVFGGDIPRLPSVASAFLGADIKPDPSGFYKITRVFRGAPWAPNDASPLHALGVKDGSFLLAIQGKPLTTKDSLWAALRGLGRQTIYLHLHDKPSLQGSRRLVVKTIDAGRETHLRYIDWVESRRLLVGKLSNGKIAYIHLPNMSAQGLVAFYRMWYPQLDKRAMLIDVRGNGGGSVSQLFLQKIMRKIWAYFKARNSEVLRTTPAATFHGHLAVLTNQNAGSDGDIFCQGFQILKLGKVFGTRTWGGVVGIRGDKRFLDRGVTTQPEFAWGAPGVDWKLENAGVTPDVEVDNTPADIEKDYDRQLDTTVTWLLQELRRDPKPLPTLAPSPDKSVEAFRKLWQKYQAPPAPRP